MVDDIKDHVKEITIELEIREKVTENLNKFKKLSYKNNCSSKFNIFECMFRQKLFQYFVVEVPGRQDTTLVYEGRGKN